MRLKGLILIAILFSKAYLIAQTDFRPGYIVLNSGDTLKGEIDYRGDELLGSVCRFKSADSETPTIYTPYNITSYRFIDSRYYVSREIQIDSLTRKVFLEYIIKGKVSIYYYRDSNDHDHYYIEKEGYGLAELPYKKGIQHKDGVAYYYESTKHIGLLRYYMKDAPEIQSRINSLKEPEHNNLIKLTEKYQSLVCKDEKCIVFERKLPFLKASIEPYFGIKRFYSQEKFNVEYGCNVYLWQPRTNEKLYLRTGFSYQYADNFADDEPDSIASNGNYNIFKIPLQFQYLHPSKIFRPTLSYGIDFYLINNKENNDGTSDVDPIDEIGYTLCLTPGFNISLSKSIAFSTCLNFDFTPIVDAILFDTKMRVLSYSINFGLRIDI